MRAWRRASASRWSSWKATAVRVAASASVSTASGDVNAGTGPPVAHSSTPTAVAVETSGTPSTAVEPRAEVLGRTGRQTASAMIVMPTGHSTSSGVPIV